MKHIKKFSQLVTESSDKAAEIQEVVKRLGYGSLKEIQQEKSLLTKLESLMKELAKSSDVSEDEAEEIEAKVIAKGSPKSLANKLGKKEEDGEPGGSNEEEVDEDAAEDIEDDTVELGEPESHSEDEGETVVTRDQEVEEEPATSPEDEEAGIKIPKSRIMSFEQFVKEQTTTVNKNVSYRNDAEEEDDALPVAERSGADGIMVRDMRKNIALHIEAGDVADYKKGKNVYATDEDGEEYEININVTDILSEDMAEEIEAKIVALGKPRKHSGAKGNVAVTKDQEITEDTAEEIEAKIVALGKPRKHSEAEGEVAVTKDQEITQVVTEQKVSNEKEFEEYAISVLKKAHPDDFDQEVADKVVSGLKSKYKSDFGAMVGALQSSMGK